MKIKVLASFTLVLALSACAPQTIIANNHQAVIDSWTAADAVALAEKECGSRGRWPSLERQSGFDYWFACNETEEARAAREKAAREAELKRADEMKKAMAAVTPSPAAPLPVPKSTRAEAPKPSPMAAPAMKSGKGFWVQVGAFRDKRVGQQFLAAIRKAHAGTLKGRELILRETNLRGRGTFHLARLWPFPRADAARRACKTIQGGGAACFVVRQR